MNVGRRIVAGTVVAALAMAACGGTSEEDEVADELVGDLRSDDGLGPDLPVEDARCIVDDLLASLGVGVVRSLGRQAPDQDFTFDALGSDEVEAIGTAVETCVDDLEPIVVEIVARGVLEDPDEDFPVAESEARCIGEVVAAELPFSRLLAIGIEADEGEALELDREEAEVFARSVVQCVDVRSLILEQVERDGTDVETVACLDREISDDQIERLYVSLFAGEPTPDDPFAAAKDACT